MVTRKGRKGKEREEICTGTGYRRKGICMGTRKGRKVMCIGTTKGRKGKRKVLHEH